MIETHMDFMVFEYQFNTILIRDLFLYSSYSILNHSHLYLGVMETD